MLCFIACIVEAVYHLTHIFEIISFSCETHEAVGADIEDFE